MSIGYACLTVGVQDTGMKSCLLKNADESNLLRMTAHNLGALERIIDYNILSGVHLFRISSDLIPFGSANVNTLNWPELFSDRLAEIGHKIRQGGLRVSMHPGQYTVLNSPDKDVSERAAKDLLYHAQVLDSLGTDAENKIILHIGGVYGDKEQAKRRFIENYRRLSDTVKRRLVIENDDKCYSIADVLDISSLRSIPVVFDNLHHAANPPGAQMSDACWINECAKTWKAKDGAQKIHYSQQSKTKKQGSHSDSIAINEFLSYYKALGRADLDIMLEVKNKNLSAVKCINCLAEDQNIKRLEREWSRYKYRVLEHAQPAYETIRQLLSNKNTYPALAFYTELENALRQEPAVGGKINAALHIWGYFKDKATEKERAIFLKNIEALKEGRMDAKPIKRMLWNMTQKYRQDYLLHSYYFLPE